MKILHTSDWHLGKKLEDISRFDEQKSVVNEIIQIADNQNPELIIIAGDIYDTANPSNDAQELFYRSVKKLSNNGKRIIIIIAGNHDSPDGINAPEPIARMNGIFMIGDLSKVIEPFELDSGIKLINSDMGFLEFRFDEYNYPLRIITTPYINELRLKKLLSAKHGEKDVLALLEKKWQELSKRYCDKNGVNILTAHLYMAGKGESDEIEPMDERSILHIGGLRKLFTDSVPEVIQYTALGHLHRFNILKSGSGYPVIYSGSILEYSFSEAMQDKYVIVSEIFPDSMPDIKKIELKSGKKLKRARFKNIDAATDWLKNNHDSYVELTIVTDKFIDMEIQKRLHGIHDKIVSIIPEVVLNNNEKDNSDNFSLNEDFETLFQKFFKYKKDNLAPSEDIMELLKEIRNMKSD